MAVHEAPFGPIRITPNRQITLPKALMDDVNLRPGDQIHVYRGVDGLLRIVDSRKVIEWLKLGRVAATKPETGETDSGAC